MKYGEGEILGVGSGKIIFYEIDKNTKPIRQVTDKKEIAKIVKSFNDRNKKVTKL